LNKLSYKAKILAASTAALLIAMPAFVPAIGQDTPESILPPGFKDPAAQTPPPPSTPKPNKPNETGAPAENGGSENRPSRPANPDRTSMQQNTPAKKSESKSSDDEDDEELEEVRIVFDVPPAGRRSLKQVGIISEARGGFAPTAFGTADGAYLQSIVKSTNGPLASRWGSIMTRRLLASRTDTPENVNGADWVAERAWLLLRMGDSVVARQLVQQVDPGNYTDRLYKVSMQTFLANGDLGGMCPLAEGGAIKTEDPTWKMARPICASLAGEQGTATAQLNQARTKKYTTGIDFLLAEKAVGAGTNGRRSVKVEWTKVTDFNGWRFGLAYATGVNPPAELLAGSGAHLNGWMAQLPMVDINTRMAAATGAASLGVLSNNAIVDIYSRAIDDQDVSSANKELAETLARTYTGSSSADKISAMAKLWDKGGSGSIYHSMLVLTARAAALIKPSSENAGDSDRLISSMMTAGLDTPAAQWAEVVKSGSLGWGILAVGAPGMQGKISYGQLDDFYDNDNSDNVHKSGLLIAGLAGLERVDPEAQQDFIEQIELDVVRASKWSQAITSAAENGQSGTVVLLAAAGLQGKDWTKIPPAHLYHITRSLRLVGLEAEARMIAAEAVTFG
jgi:hypothetical protein